MGLTPFSAADYAAGLKALLPRGRVWPDEPDSAQATVLGALAQAPARLDGDAVAVVTGALPGQSAAMLPEWEETLGLPDPCLGPNPTVAQRQGQVAARFAADGGQSLAYFQRLAASLGFQIAITEYAPSRAGAMRAGGMVASDGWAHAWRVSILADPSAASANYFRAGRSRAGDPLGSISAGQATLECEFRRMAPAHTVLLFAA